MKYYNASLKYARISPKKARLVANSLKNKSLNEVVSILKFAPNKAAKLILKLLKSAISNAKNKNADVENLSLSEIRVDNGPALKRQKIRSRGRVDIIRRPTSHISIVLSDEVKKRENNKEQSQENKTYNRKSKVNPDAKGSGLRPKRRRSKKAKSQVKSQK